MQNINVRDNQDDKNLSKQLKILDTDRNKLQNEIDNIIFKLSNFAVKYKLMNEKHIPDTVFQLIEFIEEAYKELFKSKEEVTARFDDLESNNESTNINRQNEDLNIEINDYKFNYDKIKSMLGECQKELGLKDAINKELEDKLNEIEKLLEETENRFSNQEKEYQEKLQELIDANNALSRTLTGVIYFKSFDYKNYIRILKRKLEILNKNYNISRMRK